MTHRILLLLLGLVACTPSNASEGKRDGSAQQTEQGTQPVKKNTFGLAVDGSPFAVSQCMQGTVNVVQPGGAQEQLTGYWLKDGSGRGLQLATQAGQAAVVLTVDGGQTRYSDDCKLSTQPDGNVTKLVVDCKAGERRVVGSATIAACEPARL